jgi:hypothetical protein
VFSHFAENDVDTSVDTALGWTPPVRQTLLLHLAVE